MRKLVLNKETLHLLTTSKELQGVAGGTIDSLECATENVNLCTGPDTRHICQTNTTGGQYC